MHVASLLSLSLLLLLGVAGASTWWTPPRDAMADASNALGVALLQDFVAAPGNVALSPLAAAATLVALWEGARGDTALQLRRALELPEDRERVRAGFRDLHRLLRAGHAAHQLCLGDLFLLNAEAAPLEPAYVDVLRFYGYQLEVQLANSTTALPATTITAPPETTDKPGALPGITTTPETPSPTIQETVEQTTTPPSSTAAALEATSASGPEQPTEETTAPLPPRPGPTMTTASSTTLPPERKETSRFPRPTTTTATPTTLPPEIKETAAVPTDGVPGLTMTSSPPTTLPPEMRETSGIPTDGVEELTTTVNVPPAVTEAPVVPETTTSPPEVRETSAVPPDTVAGATTTVDVPPVVTEAPVVPETTTPVPVPTTSPPEVRETSAVPPDTVPGATTTAETTTSPPAAVDLPPTLPPGASTMQVPSTGVPETPSAVDVPSTDVPETTTTPPGLSIASEVPESSDTEPPRSRRAILGPSSRRLQGVGDEAEVAPFLVRGALQRLVPALRTSGRLPFARIRDLRACVLQLPIQDGSYRVLLVLPETPEDLPWTVAALRRVSLRHVVRRLRTTAVSVAVPLFRLHGVVLLTSTLQHLGVWDVFDPRRADLSCMSAATPLYVVNVAQRVDLDLRPRPLEARWAGGGNVVAEDVFVADRAFLFFVLDAVADVALLAGKVEDPLSSDIT